MLIEKEVINAYMKPEKLRMGKWRKTKKTTKNNLITLTAYMTFTTIAIKPLQMKIIMKRILIIFKFQNDV